MSVAHQAIPKPGQQPNMEWAKSYVASLNHAQRNMLQKIYAEHQRTKEAEEKAQKEAEEKALKEKAEQEEAARKESEQQKLQQQEILALLTSQKPITIDVVRSSTSPDDFLQMASCSSSSDNGEMTVKAAILGKMKTAHPSYSPSQSIKPYRPRGSRERLFCDGHLYVFDKLSYDCKKRFFRCEKKKTCASRVHTGFDTDRVIFRVQSHNHEAPSASDLAQFDIDFTKIRTGHMIPLNLLSNRTQPSATPVLPGTGEENENPLLLLNNEQDKDKKSVCLRLPENFNQCTEEEIKEIEMTLTKYLMQNTELRNELMSDKKALPTFFPDQKIEGIVLFVAKCGQDETIFQMIMVKERTEMAIRAALQEHFGMTTSRQLMINVSSKINVPLTQPMIDQWKTEEFIRVDVSKPNGWKVFQVKECE